tara:strand:- start:388 stop:651 length:264 start_codon:yes stop_codon:yes gene_type:complete
VIEIINEYGFPIVAVVGMGWFIWFIYNYITNLIAEKLDQANVVLIALIDRIRMLDNDIIRLKSKINTVIELQELQKKQDEKKDEKTK